MVANFKYLIVLLFIVTTNSFSQENVNPTNKTYLPESIYSSSLYQNSDLNSFYSINKKLDLKGYKFAIINPVSIEEGYFTIPFQKFDKVLTSYIFETYQDLYHNQDLKKSFFKVSSLYNVPNQK
tara:strand:+ start:8181 stop:8552 length:372 start_codon:yes stop_codon:yes gene_type:complete